MHIAYKHPPPAENIFSIQIVSYFGPTKTTQEGKKKKKTVQCCLASPRGEVLELTTSKKKPTWKAKVVHNF